ncbi:hypothetical protein K438DRAFT_2025171 [Mycena galopus ATCC 62051]|nr:hypothetical protein K438DRAFT_2025171 [Mycena galopus ATCC 62051]
MRGSEVKAAFGSELYPKDEEPTCVAVKFALDSSILGRLCSVYLLPATEETLHTPLEASILRQDALSESREHGNNKLAKLVLDAKAEPSGGITPESAPRPSSARTHLRAPDFSFAAPSIYAYTAYPYPDRTPRTRTRSKPPQRMAVLGTSRLRAEGWAWAEDDPRAVGHHGRTDAPSAAWSTRAGVDVESGSNDETRSDDATDGEDVHGPHYYHYRVLGRRHTDAGCRVYIYRPDDNTTPTPVHTPTGEGPPAYGLINASSRGSR